MAKGNWPDRFWPIEFIRVLVARCEFATTAAKALLAEAEAGTPQGVPMSGGKGGRASAFHKIFSGANWRVWGAGEKGTGLSGESRRKGKRSDAEILGAHDAAKLQRLNELADAAKLAGNKQEERKFRNAVTVLLELAAEGEEE